LGTFWYIFNGGFYIVVTFVFLGVEIILFAFAILPIFLSEKKPKKKPKKKRKRKKG